MSSIANARTVLIYAPYVGSGGVRRFVLRLLDAWLETADPAAWRFRVLSQPVDGNGDELPWPPAIFTPVSGDRIKQNLGAALCDFLQTNQNAFWSELRRHASGVDVVWLPQPWWTLRMTEDRVDLPAHIIPTVHDFAFDELGWDGLFGDRFRDEARNFVSVSSRLVFSSRFTAGRAADRYGMQPERGRVIHLADFVPEPFVATPAEADRVSRRYGMPDRYWLAFHAMGHKDPQTILAALARTKATMSATEFVPLVIAGMHTEALRPDAGPQHAHAASLRKSIDRLGLVHGRDYHVLGFLPDADIAGLYAGASGCIVASRSEAGLSASVFEAQRAGVPLIHSDIGPFVERLGMDDRFAVRFRVGDAEDLARAMQLVAGDPVAARARAVAARETFCSRTWEDVACEYLKVFAEVCAEGPSTRVWSPAAESVQRPPPSDAALASGPRRRLRDRIRRLFRRRR